MINDNDFFEFLGRPNLPLFLGDFDTLLRTALMNKGTAYDYIDGLVEGKGIGRQEGTEATIKNIISSGKEKIMVTKEGKIIPFSNIETDLFGDKNVNTYIKEYMQDDYKNKKLKRDLKNMLHDKYEIDIEEDKAIEFSNEYMDVLKKDINKYLNLKLDNEINYENKKEYSKKLRKKKRNLGTVKNNIEFEVNKLYSEGKKIENETGKPIKEDDELFKNIEYYEDEIFKKDEKIKKIEETERKIDTLLNFKTDYKILKDNIDEGKHNLNKTKGQWKNDFKLHYKDGNTAILLTDKFNIYDIKNIRGIFPKNEKTKEGIIKPLSEIIQQRNEFKIPYDKKELIKDLRSKPLGSEKVMDYIDVPSIKYSLDDLVKKKYKSNDLPMPIIEYIKAVNK